MPEMFGRYQLLRKLATGGMAEIHLARQQGPEGFSKLLVIKRILPHLSGNDEFVKMFLDEARIAARLNHANVVQIFDLGAEGEHYFIAMEYLHGEDARRVWKQAEKQEKPLPVALACRIVMDACAGLDYAHKKLSDAGQPLNIVHRDVSPQNIIVTFEGGVKVVDFGIAKAADQSSVTRSGVVKGKYSYMSPEQASGSRKIDHRTDQFALGIVLYELVTGERLFKRQSDVETLKAVERCEVEPPSKVNPRVQRSLDAVILKALSRNPEDRYPDCLAFQLAIEQWVVENRLPSSGAQLASFLSEIYAERLAEEKKIGHPLWEIEDSASGDKADKKASAPSESPQVRRPTPSHLTALAKKNSLVASRPAARSGSLPPPVRTSGSFNAMPRSSIGGPKPTALDRPISGAVPALPDDEPGVGATIAELSQTLSTTASQVPSHIARRQSRRSLFVGLGAGAVVVLIGMVALALLTARPVAVTVQPTPPSQPARTASVSILSDPPGAEVVIDGVRRGHTPLPPTTFAVGSTLAIKAELEGFEPTSQSYKVDHDDALQLKLTRATVLTGPVGTNPPEHTEHAAPSRATLVLDSPIPLSATLDGRPIRIPTREVVAPGKHKLVVSSSTLDYAQAFELSLHAGELVSPRLTPAVGKLRVVTGDGYGDVLIGGIKRGQTPMPAFDLAEGTHTIVVTNAELGKTKQQRVVVTSGQTATVSINLDE